MPIATKASVADTATFSKAGFTASKFLIADTVRFDDVAGLYLEGNETNDKIWGSQQADDIHGNGGNDVLYGQGGNDRLFGGEGDDYLNGGIGDDILDGGNGNDFLYGGAGADRLIGGAGEDTVSYANASSVTVQLGYQGFGSDAQGDTYVGIEHVIGSNFDDSLFGDAGNNTLNGGGGWDHLIGGAGRDVLIGGSGQDTLTGDTAGVWEEDVFVIQRGVDAPFYVHDTITDFQDNYDKIALSGYSTADFGSDGKLGRGILYEDGVISFTHDLDASDRLYFDEVGSALFECEIEMVNGEAHLISSRKVVDVDVMSINAIIDTGDFIFM